jgi:hypothetical protein
VTDEIRIDLSEVEKFFKNLESMDRIVAPRAHRLMRISVDTMEAEVVGRTPVGATGQLRGATATEIRGTRLNLIGEVTNPLLYAPIVERGRRPGKMPPVDTIEYWVRRKGIAGGEEARGVAFVIARAIGARGTKGAAMFWKGFEAAEPHVLNLWRGLPGEIVEALARG